MNRKTYLAVGELVQAAAHMHGATGPVQFTVSEPKNYDWCGVEDGYAEVTEEEFFMPVLKNKWEKISTNACGKGTYEFDGWTIEHCGHPTANYPYMLYDPAGNPHLAANGRAHATLAAAKRFQQEIAGG